MAATLAAIIMIAATMLGFIGGDKPETTTLELGSGTSSAQKYTLEKATSSAAQVKGLGGRDTLAPSAGMLFEYEDNTQRCIWMKDMRFNIDVIWVDATNRVVSIVPDLKPDSYPQSYCANALKVIELNAGTASKHGLRVGQILQL